jgi:DNA (cytosine-5)-methyltransferase 1
MGALDLGFMWEGFQLVWANDNSEHAVRSHRLNFSSEVICEDISKLDVQDIPNADVIIGGPPCQSFSLLGQRQDNDPRGQLVFRFAEIIKAKCPQAFVMENVPGMAASRINGKRLPDVLFELFVDLGYHVARMNLMATDYLVPQRRRRLFLFGFLEREPIALDPTTYSREVYGINPVNFDLSARAAIGDLGECALAYPGVTSHMWWSYHQSV